MSKIEVNTVDAQCGSTVTIGSAGKTVSVPGNIVKTNALQASDGGNIVNQCGTTVTLGASGDTIALASGASQTGFGRTGTVDWVTTPKVTGDSPITAVTGKGYFLNTTAGTITLNLPAGSAGDIISMADYAATWQTNVVTVAANGTEKIGGVNEDATLSTEGQSVTLVYVDSTQGWVNTMDSTSNVRGENFIVATVSGACNTLTTAPCCANAKIATFLGPGTFCVASLSTCSANDVVDYLVVAGGAGGGGNRALGNANGGGGGGAGGYRESGGTASGCYPVSPLGSSPSPVAALSVSVTGFPITVGAGGAAQPSSPPALGNDGNNSTFSTITSTAGGGGAGSNCCGGRPGGSGGGGGPTEAGCGSAGNGNTPPVSPPQGTNGTIAPASVGQPGGSALACTGATSSINASATARAGGGGGGYQTGKPGGGGNGGPGAHDPGSAGTTNTGGGGGGAAGGASGANGGAGGSGVVIIRYKFQ